MTVVEQSYVQRQDAVLPRRPVEDEPIASPVECSQTSLASLSLPDPAITSSSSTATTTDPSKVEAKADQLAVNGNYDEAHREAGRIRDGRRRLHALRQIEGRMHQNGHHHRLRENFERQKEAARELPAEEKAREISQVCVDQAKDGLGTDAKSSADESVVTAREVQDPEKRAGTQRDVGSNLAKAAKYAPDAGIDPKPVFEEARGSARLISDPQRRAEMMGSIAGAMKTAGLDNWKDAYEEAVANGYRDAQLESQYRREQDIAHEDSVKSLVVNNSYDAAISEAQEIKDDGRRSVALRTIARALEEHMKQTQEMKNYGRMEPQRKDLASAIIDDADAERLKDVRTKMGLRS